MFARHFLRPFPGLFVILWVMASLVGCAEWKRERETEWKLPRAEVASNAIGLDLLLAQIPVERRDTLEEVWRTVDFLKIDLETRQLLDRNGIRIGILPSGQTPTITRLFENEPIESEELDDWQRQVHRKGLLTRESSVRSFSRIQHQAGSEHPIPVSDTWERQSWIVHGRRGRTVGVGENVEAEFELKTYEAGDGAIRIRLMPKLTHGQPRPQFDVDEDQFLVRSKKAEVKLRDLVLDIELEPGEILLVGATPDVDDLGKLFFQPRRPLLLQDLRVRDEGNLPPVPDGEQKILMIRLLPSQSDALFSRQR